MLVLLLACTGSKTRPPSPNLLMRNYAHEGFSACLDHWQSAIGSTAPATRAAELYKGGYWAAARRAVAVCTLPARPLIVSAGFGLIEPEEWVPSYSATFGRGKLDSIPGADRPQGSLMWWEGLGGATRLMAVVDQTPQARLVAAIPRHYLAAVAPTLGRLSAQLGPDRVTVLAAAGSAVTREMLAPNWVDLDARMVRTVGGAAGQLTARVLLHLVSRIESEEAFTPARIHEIMAALMDEEAPPLYPKRERCTEDDVRYWITTALVSADPPTSASIALRRFRDSGRAFEQKRFGRVYHSVVSEAQG